MHHGNRTVVLVDSPPVLVPTVSQGLELSKSESDKVRIQMHSVSHHTRVLKRGGPGVWCR